VGVARVPYRAYMDFGDGNPPVLVQYYFVDDKTPFLPFPVNFANRFTWSTRKPWLPFVGEVWTPSNPRVSGARVRAYPLGHWIGTPQQWLTGLPPGTPYVPLIAPGTPQGTAPNVAGVAAGIALARVQARVRSRSWAIVRVSAAARVGVSADTRQGASRSVSASVNCLASAATSAAGRGTGHATAGCLASALTGGTGHATGSAKATVSAAAQTAAAGHGLPQATATAATSAVTHSPGKATVKATGTCSVSAATAAFQVVTPTGGCGSLPASMKCRFTGGSGQWSTRYAGLTVTLTWGGTAWSFSGTDNLGSAFNGGMSCNAGTHAWDFGFNVPLANTTHPTGTSGASPNLTGTVNGGSYTGSVNITITRT
jgi:hypothetical protein